MWPLRLKLGLTLSNKTDVDGTHCGEVGRIRNSDRKMAKDPRDSRRKNELISGCYILIKIKDRNDEVRGEVNGKILNKGQKKASTRLNNRVIVRQWSKNKCHHYVKESRTFCKT